MTCRILCTLAVLACAVLPVGASGGGATVGGGSVGAVRGVGCVGAAQEGVPFSHAGQEADHAGQAAYSQQMPMFQGGDANAFKAWVDSRLQYPERLKASGEERRVTLSFTVSSSGKLCKVKLLRSCGIPELDEEAVRVVSSSPDWTPGGFLDRNGKLITKDISYTFPVIFKPDPSPYPFEEFKLGGGGSVRIHCIRHGSVVVEIKPGPEEPASMIAVDPVMNFYGSQVPYGWFRNADAILITHGHGDHLDTAAVHYLQRRPSAQKSGQSTEKQSGEQAGRSAGKHSDGQADRSTAGQYGRQTEIFGNQAGIAALGYGTVLPCGGQGKVVLRSFRLKKDMDELVAHITAVPAYNTTKDHMKFHPKGNGNGYVIDIDGFRIYVAGDTEPIREMSRLGHINVALLPCNQPYTMTPQQCMKAALKIRPDVLIPYHTGETDLTPLIKGLEGTGIDVRTHDELR